MTFDPTKLYAESAGEFSEWEHDPTMTCRKCKATGQIWWRVWDSSDGGYQDEKQQCRACGNVVWVDGGDA